MHDPNTRRGFLRGLTTLPLIGGGVTLIGNPTKAAEPVTRHLLDCYDTWLFYERRFLRFERYGSGAGTKLGNDHFAVVNTQTGEPLDWVAQANAGGRYHGGTPAPAG